MSKKPRYGEDPPTKPLDVKARYTAQRYPGWKHNGQPCRVVGRQGSGVYIVFEGDDGRYLVGEADLEYT